MQKSIEIAIDHGKYYYEVGLLVPFIVNGARTVTLTPLSATGGERRISVVEDSVVRPALALSLFPWGRRQARVSAWGPFRCGDLFGVQLGVDLDLGDPFNRIYVGGVLEPVAGLSVNLGLAMVKGQFVPSGYAAGTVLSVEDTFTPDTRYMPRLYLGATVTTDVLTTIKGAAAEVRTSAGR
ncbi:Hypothetical protein CAP_7558 [Chondromyces apiculatus DSM 436]|uniref:Uncharacterized protein n=1 Tax=Chondromyces apiculatus DSM 436 TaxID=1192034 RepID=A0A017SZA5_9BACT|nr:Hypothetical protein CAP_7558 [Chondromyces apiculatus DSM 436]